MISLLAPPARGGDAKPPPSAKQVRAALERFEKDFSGSRQARLGALEKLGSVHHADVAAVLLKIATGKTEPPVAAAAFRTLEGQKEFAKRLGPSVAKHLLSASAAARKAFREADVGLPVDPESGLPVVDTTAGKLALHLKRQRSDALAAAVRCLRVLGHRPKNGAAMLRPFVHDGGDALVDESLRLLGEWRDFGVLPDLLDLYQIYPSEKRWQTWAVLRETGGPEAAQRAWLRYFGDPDKRRVRPRVVRAARRAVKAITGRACATIEELRREMRRPKTRERIVRARAEGGGKRGRKR